MKKTTQSAQCHNTAPRLTRRLVPLAIMALLVAAVLLGSANAALATDYYVDYSSGDDANAGTSAEAAWKHAPGDRAAKDKPAEVKLAPGDRVIFKGGVSYEGAITITASGTAEKPVIYDGNTAGQFGTGKAIIEGGVLLTDWKRCENAEQAKGNPRWADIFYVDVPKPIGTANLTYAEQPLTVAQDPNPSEAIFQEKPSDYYVVDGPMATNMPAKIYAESGTHTNSQRPLILMITPGNGSAVVSPVIGASVSVEVPEAITAKSVGISMQPNYTAPREVAFYGDGKELLVATIEKDKRGMQTFDLPQAATFKKFTIKILSVHGEVKNDWTAIVGIAAIDENGENKMQFQASTMLTDPKVLRQQDPTYYDGMKVAFHGGANAVIYLDVKKYDPEANRLHLGFYAGKQYKQTRYSLMNSVRLIDVPGEYSSGPAEDSKLVRIYLLPVKVVDGQPAEIRMSRRGNGFLLQQASHVTVQGFRILRQGNNSRTAGLSANGPAEGVIFRDCEVALLRGTGITTYKVDNVLVEDCYVHDCPGHTKGIVLRNGSNAVTRNCRLVRNTSTALDYYTVTGGSVVGCEVTDHRGMHANSLTFYLGCKDILIEGNKVARGNVALTFQQAENLIIRNNVFDGNGATTIVGIWPGQPLKNVQILNNTFIRSNHDVSWQTGLFTNSKNLEGLVVRNNIIDGLCGTPPFPKTAVFTHNLYTRLGPDRESKNFGPGEFFEPELDKIFVDAENGDFRLKPGSPAIGAGAPLDSVEADIDGKPRPKGKPLSIGAYEGAAE